MTNMIREYMTIISEGQEKNQAIVSNGGGEVTMVYNNN